ncbi:hypothetical protein ACFSL4_32845 [Streptomyces caeni]|uniref:Uncharacterized protein n=1 Tax=Streptomyces caeni TaxID=2307231 RepID=A0ABW4J1W5_9ACTN
MSARPAYTVLVALFTDGDGGLTIALRTVRSPVIPPAAFGTPLSLTLLLLLPPFPLAGFVIAVTPAPYPAAAIGGCAVLQTLALVVTFVRLRSAPVLRGTVDPSRAA